MSHPYAYLRPSTAAFLTATVDTLRARDAVTELRYACRCFARDERAGLVPFHVLDARESWLNLAMAATTIAARRDALRGFWSI